MLRILYAKYSNYELKNLIFFSTPEKKKARKNFLIKKVTNTTTDATATDIATNAVGCYVKITCIKV